MRRTTKIWSQNGCLPLKHNTCEALCVCLVLLKTSSLFCCNWFRASVVLLWFAHGFEVITLTMQQHGCCHAIALRLICHKLFLYLPIVAPCTHTVSMAFWPDLIWFDLIFAESCFCLYKSKGIIDINFRQYVQQQLASEEVCTQRRGRRTRRRKGRRRRRRRRHISWLSFWRIYFEHVCPVV